MRSSKAPPLAPHVGITARRPISTDPAVTYSLIGDTTGGGFTINAATGVVTVADPTKIDYESAPLHSDIIIVQASDGTRPVRRPSPSP